MAFRVEEKFDPPYCNLTHEIIIEPVIAYCAEVDEVLTDEKIASVKGHIFEDKALRQYYWHHQQKDEPFTCPICQSHKVIKKVIPDEDLAKKIKTKFRDISDENARIYDEQKADIEVDLKAYAGMPIPDNLDGEIEAERTGIDDRALKKEAGEKIDDKYEKQKKAYDEVKYYIETGDLVTAEQKASNLENVVDKNDSLEKIVLLHIENNNLDTAKKIIPLLPFLDSKDNCTEKVILKHIENGELKKAEILIPILLLPYDIDNLYKKIVLKYLELYQNNSEVSLYGVKNLKEALRITNLLTNSNERNHLFEESFYRCIELDDFKNAKAIVDNHITKTTLKERLSKKLVDAYINRPNYNFEDLKKAFDITSKIGDNLYKKEIYKKILKAAIKLPYNKDNYVWLEKIVKYLEDHYERVDNDVDFISNAHLNADHLNSAMRTISFSLLNPKGEIRLKVAKAFLNRNPVTENNLKKALRATSSIYNKALYKKEINELYVNIYQKALENKFYRQSFSAMNRVPNFFTFQKLFFKTIGVLIKNTCISFFRAVGIFTYKTLYVLSTPFRFVVSKMRRRRGY